MVHYIPFQKYVIHMPEAKKSHISNPLTLISIFAGVSETVSTGVLPLIDAELQAIFIWFVMLFPTALVATFFLILLYRREILYAPSDFRDDNAFMQIAGYTSSDSSDHIQKLSTFWKGEDGTINAEHESQLKAWMKDNDLAHLPSITYFLHGAEHAKLREKAVVDLKL